MTIICLRAERYNFPGLALPRCSRGGGKWPSPSRSSNLARSSSTAWRYWRSRHRHRKLATAGIARHHTCRLAHAVWRHVCSLASAGSGPACWLCIELARFRLFLRATALFLRLAIQRCFTSGSVCARGTIIVALSTKQRSAAQSLRRMHDDLQTALSELERVYASLQTENADRRRAEAELRRSERALQTIIDTIPAYVARLARTACRTS